MATLEINDLTMRFGGLEAVKDLNIVVNEGEILGLIGPNGSGKTTVFNIISGLYTPTTGNVIFNGLNVTKLPPWERTRLGISRTFQNLRIFKNMTALEHIIVGRHLHTRAGLGTAVLRRRVADLERKRVKQYAEDILRFLGLYERKDELAKNLPYGLQRRVEIARALATEPKLLLLDEPAAGMNRQEKRELMQLVLSIRSRGITVVIIEHDMRTVLGISDRVVVLNFGRKIAEGKPHEVQRNPDVLKAYLGEHFAGGSSVVARG